MSTGEQLHVPAAAEALDPVVAASLELGELLDARVIEDGRFTDVVPIGRMQIADGDKSGPPSLLAATGGGPRNNCRWA